MRINRTDLEDGNLNDNNETKGAFFSDNLIFGDNGNDTLISFFGDDLLDGGAGDDELRSGPGDDTVLGGDGFDRLIESGDYNYFLSDTILTIRGGLDEKGNFWRDEENILESIEEVKITGGDSRNIISAQRFQGRLVVNARGGNDLISGGQQGDFLSGEEGRDIIIGNAGDDSISGGASNDTISGGDGRDSLRGDGGNDRLRGNAGDDSIDGGNGTDLLIEKGNVDFFLSNTQLVGLGVDSLVSIERASLEGGLGDNRIDAQAFNGRTQLLGNEGDDTIVGGQNADDIVGGEGDDFISGGEGDDTLIGGEGIDILFESGNFSFTLSNLQLTGKGNDFIRGFEHAILTGGDDDNRIDALAFSGTVQLNGQEGDDTLLGSIAGSTLTGGAGDDNLRGQGNRDLFSGGTGNNRIIGAGGIDRVFDSGATDFRLTDAELIGTGVNRLFSIEEAVLTTAGDHSIDAVGFSGSGRYLGGSGANLIQGGEGSDEIQGQAGNDSLNGNAGNDTIDGGRDSDVINGGEGDDSILGGVGDDTLLGQSGDDTIEGGLGSDLINGGEGNDFINGGEGRDRILAAADTHFTLTDISLSGQGQDRLASIEMAGIQGGAGNNSINAAGFSGETTLFGLGGNDNIQGGSGGDSVLGGEGNDFMFGNNGNDTVRGETGNDTLSGGAGNDSLDGGTGFDQIVEVADRNFQLTDQFIKGLGTDRISSIEAAFISGGLGNNILDASAFSGNTTLSGAGGDDVVIGTIRGDNLSGGADADSLSGGKGSDTLRGGTGDDTLEGGLGNDLLDGGQGVDLVFASADVDFTLTDSCMTGEGTDTLTGIERAEIIAGVSDNTINVLGFSGLTVLTGGAGSDRILGGTGHDVINGTSRAARGEGERDVLTSNSQDDRDQFILGDENSAYYLDDGFLFSNTSFARITDFDRGPGLGDQIQLNGSAADYRLATVTIDGQTGVGIFRREGLVGDFDDDLIGLVQGEGVSVTSLNLNHGSQFSFVS